MEDAQELLNQSYHDTLRLPKQKLRIAPGGDLCRPLKDFISSNLPANMPMDPSHLSADFRDFLTCLNEAGVDYLLIGGHAVAYYGYVRPTRDIDVWIAVAQENAEKLVRAITAFFGCELRGLTKEWFLDLENVTRFGVEPNRIEILPKISGVGFAQAFARRVSAQIDGQTVSLINLDDLIANKKASARLKDLADVEQLTKE